MRITVCYSTSRIGGARVLRELSTDGRRLILEAGWRMSDAEVYRQVADQLTDIERVELQRALGLDQQQP